MTGAQNRLEPRAMSQRVISGLWWLTGATVFYFSPPSFNGWRRWLLKVFGARVDRGVMIWPTVRIDQPWNLRIGEQVVVCHRVILNCQGGITIGHRTRISQYGWLCTRTRDPQHRGLPAISKPIVIGDDVWIGADAFVDAGVTVGARTVLGARASALDDLPEGVVATGNPAKAIKDREPQCGPAEDCQANHTSSN